jgi:taurine dioxygenase
MSHYTIAPMTSHGTGAEIHGLDLTAPVDDALKKQINADFAKHHVLIFRDQTLSAAQFAAAGERIFGPLLSQHHKDVRATGHPEVFEIRNTQVAPGQYRISGGSWHTDHSNHPCPPRATALHTVTLPSYGGDTQFVNMHFAYDELSADMKRRIEGLKAIHAWESRYTPRKMRKLSEDSAKALPPPGVHPLVRVHPENARKFLYLNPVRVDGIVGMEDGPSMALVGELVAHATQQKFEYRHQWLMGDVVIWDDRSVMHQANGDYDMNEVRYLYRIMIQDDPKKWLAEGEKTWTTATATA